MIDEILKIGLLILGVAFLFLYYSNARRSNIQRGRYQLKTLERDLFIITDTQTGTLYINRISNDVLTTFLYSPITGKGEKQLGGWNLRVGESLPREV